MTPLRRRLTALVFLVLAALLGANLYAVAQTKNDAACRAQAAKQNPDKGVNSSEVLDYNACREDIGDAADARQDAALARIEAKLATSSPTPTPTPTPTPRPTATPSASPTATPTPNPTPTGTPTFQPAGACQPGSERLKFTGEGSAELGNGYNASAEQWGVNGYSYKATEGYCSHDSWYADVTTDNAKGDGAVKAYPSIRRIYHDWSGTPFSSDPRLSSFSELTIDFASTDPASCSGCIYDTAFDIWLNGIGSGDQGTELMVWTHNVGQRPYGSKVGTTTIGGRSWDLWSGNSNHYIAYVPTDGSYLKSGTVDVVAFVNDLKAKGRIASSTVSDGTSDPRVGQLSYGVEPVSTGGVSKHWDFTLFTVHDGGKTPAAAAAKKAPTDTQRVR